MNQNYTADVKNIDIKIIELKKELIFYKIKKATKQEIKPHILKKIKYQIANLLTQKSLSSDKITNK